MKDRWIDLALPAALGLICILIVITLFSLRPNQSEPVNGSAPPPAASAPQPTSVEPALPQPTAPTGPTITPTSPLDTLPTIAIPEEAEAEEEGEEAVAEEEEASPPSPRVPIEGETPLNRIGFSFAGVVGACGVELEPWRHIAVSRDFFAEYECGAEVTLTLPEEVAGRTTFTAIIGDTMNPVHERTVNVYIAEDEPAFQYGVLEGGALEGPN